MVTDRNAGEEKSFTCRKILHKARWYDVKKLCRSRDIANST